MNTMKRSFTGIYKKEGKWVAAWIEEIPGVNAQGKTMREAKTNLKEALELILETNRSLAIGKGGDIKREPISVSVPA